MNYRTALGHQKSLKSTSSTVKPDTVLQLSCLSQILPSSINWRSPWRNGGLRSQRGVGIQLTQDYDNPTAYPVASSKIMINSSMGAGGAPYAEASKLQHSSELSNLFCLWLRSRHDHRQTFLWGIIFVDFIRYMVSPFLIGIFILLPILKCFFYFWLGFSLVWDSIILQYEHGKDLKSLELNKRFDWALPMYSWSHHSYIKSKLSWLASPRWLI